MENDTRVSYPSRQILQVLWDSGPEFIDLTEIQERKNLESYYPLVTSDIRTDARVVFYKPRLEWKSDCHFLLHYDDGGKFESGDDAFGDKGTATYRRSKQGWKCSWICRENGLPGSAPKCNFFDTATVRELELVSRTKRDRAFRELIKTEYGCVCAISGETNECVLDAAHVLEVRDNGPDNIFNGIMLRKDLHALFDARLLTIRLDGKYELDSSVHSCYQKLFFDLPDLNRCILDRISKNLAIRNGK
jgi:hypothetical protein